MAYASLTTALLTASTTATYTRKTAPPQVPWLNSQIVRESRRVKKLWKADNNKKTQHTRDSLRQATQRLQTLVREAKKKSTKKMLTTLKKNPRKFYSLLRQLRGTSFNIPSLRDKHILHSTHQSKAELIAHSFKEVFNSRTDPTNDPPQRPLSTPPLTKVLTTPEEVLLHLESIKDTSPGPDRLTPLMLRTAAPLIAPIFADFHNSSMLTGYIPPEWKVAHITPIPKNDDPSQPSNYRPISLNPLLSKVSETFVKNALLQHIIINKFISHTQHGALPRKSVVSNLLSMLDLITLHLDQHTPCDVIYFDLRKAFDTVPHALLLRKLAAWGIKGQLLKWIANWLVDRKQIVVVEGASSQPYDAPSGVPQGSVIGPLLFLLFIEDIDQFITNFAPKFLDDLKLVVQLTSTSHHSSVQFDIDSALKWAEVNGMRWGVDKWKVMHLGTTNPRHQ
eukprot:GHVN01025502.1.p1 GENE.GHVN01025502.1~~GHVN01025502.1.p1  ORF type:complete len:449 (+),score=61.44 GHVN01025502.1:236-1582(+)